MKFGKEFASQMVPEWQDAYMNYQFLKSLQKQIQVFKQRNKPSTNQNLVIKRSLTLYRSFSGLTTRRTNSSPKPQTPSPDIEAQVILVNAVRQNGEDGLETTFLNRAEEGVEYELVYFKSADDEFNKVVRFYKEKMEEVMKEANVLNKQMDALIAFRVKVENPKGWANGLEETRRLALDIEASTAALFASSPSSARASGRVQMDIRDEGSSINLRQPDESSDDKDAIEIKPMNLNDEGHGRPNTITAIRPAPLEILTRLKFNAIQETPHSTIKGFLNLPKQTDLKFSKMNLKKAEEQLKKAFVEFNHKLRLLKSYMYTYNLCCLISTTIIFLFLVVLLLLI